MISKLLLLVTAANIAPLIAAKILGRRFVYPLDARLRFFDGRPLLGESKTVRGVVASLLLTSALAPLVGLQPRIGTLIALGAMAGDMTSSFIKRRAGLPPSSQVFGLDQIPESLIPLLVIRYFVPVTTSETAIIIAIFVVGEMFFSRLLYALHLRDRPY